MHLTYLDGTTYDDPLFDKPIEDQRQYIASCVNCHPDPKYWNMAQLDMLLAIRRLHGQKRFYREVGRMLDPNFR